MRVVTSSMLLFAFLFSIISIHASTLKIPDLEEGLVLRCFEASSVGVYCHDLGVQDKLSEGPYSDFEIVISDKLGKEIRSYGYARGYPHAACERNRNDIRWVMRKLKKSDRVCIAAYEDPIPSSNFTYELWHSLYTKYGNVRR